MLSVPLRYTDSNYPFGIFKLCLSIFVPSQENKRSCICVFEALSLPLFNDYSVELWNCSDILTVWYFCFSLYRETKRLVYEHNISIWSILVLLFQTIPGKTCSMLNVMLDTLPQLPVCITLPQLSGSTENDTPMKDLYITLFIKLHA